jgi:Protein of unknown function (DUF3467)
MCFGLSFAVAVREQLTRVIGMNTSKQAVGFLTPPQAQPDPQSRQTSDVVVDDSKTQPLYSNFCRVTATPEEVILDFGLNAQPFATGRQDVKVTERVVMNPYTAKRLLTALGMTIQRHEQTFGAIELDIRRRLSTPQP